MRIGVLSDTHIPERVKDIPPKILQDFKNVDLIIHAGDFVSFSVVKTLASVCPEIKAVYGNMDSYEIRQKFPEKELIQAGNFKIGLIHGFGAPQGLIELVKKTFAKDNPDIIIFGHSHTAVNKKEGKILFFNPGSPTDKIFSPYNSYGIIEINDKIDARIIKL